MDQKLDLSLYQNPKFVVNEIEDVSFGNRSIQKIAPQPAASIHFPDLSKDISEILSPAREVLGLILQKKRALP